MVNCDYLYDKEYFRDQFDMEHFVEKKLSYSCYDDAYIVPLKDSSSGVYTNQKKYVAGTGLNDAWQNPLNESELGNYVNTDDTVVYLGIFVPVWGHIITDVIRRFWFLKSDDYVQKFGNCKFVFAKMNGEGGVIPENASKLFAILGLDESKLLNPNEVVRCKKVVVPDACFFLDVHKERYCFTSEYRELIRAVNSFQREHFTVDKSSEKLYFSYEAYGKQKGNVGEWKLERFFAEHGYKIVYPEKHTLEEQLNMLANCRYFASTVGSCSHNIVFLQERTNVILIPRAFYLTTYQRALDDVVDLEIYYIDASLSVVASRDLPTIGPHFFYVSENLRNFFGITEPCDKQFYKKQFVDFKKYLCFAKAQDDWRRRYMPEYYAKQFAYCMEQLQRLHSLRRRFWYMVIEIRCYGLRAIKSEAIAFVANHFSLIKKLRRR